MHMSMYKVVVGNSGIAAIAESGLARLFENNATSASPDPLIN